MRCIIRNDMIVILKLGIIDKNHAETSAEAVLALLSKTINTISICWGDAGCDGSNGRVCGFLIRSK
jgi:hypothetical protein